MPSGILEKLPLGYQKKSVWRIGEILSEIQETLRLEYQRHSIRKPEESLCQIWKRILQKCLRNFVWNSGELSSKILERFRLKTVEILSEILVRLLLGAWRDSLWNPDEIESTIMERYYLEHRRDFAQNIGKIHGEVSYRILKNWRNCSKNIFRTASWREFVWNTRVISPGILERFLPNPWR